MTGLKSTATWMVATRVGTPGPRPGCSMPMRTGAWRSSGCGCGATPTTVQSWAVHLWRRKRSCSSPCATRSVPGFADGGVDVLGPGEAKSKHRLERQSLAVARQLLLQGLRARRQHFEGKAVERRVGRGIQLVELILRAL